MVGDRENHGEGDGRPSRPHRLGAHPHRVDGDETAGGVFEEGVAFTEAAALAAGEDAAGRMNLVQGGEIAVG